MSKPSDRLRELARERCIRRGTDDARQPVHNGMPLCTAITCDEHPSGVECVTIAEAFNFNLGNAIKYVWRAGLKGGVLEDLRKARWYLDREIERLEKAGVR